jgi:hypothetical protein
LRRADKRISQIKRLAGKGQIRAGTAARQSSLWLTVLVAKEVCAAVGSAIFHLCHSASRLSIQSDIMGNDFVAPALASPG